MGPRSALPSAIPAASARIVVRAQASNGARVGRIDEWHVEKTQVFGCYPFAALGAQLILKHCRCVSLYT
jgi:hypothetical protein